MSNVPQISGKEVIKALGKIGFIVSRQKGSHNHKIIRKGTLLNGILKAVNLSLDDFKKLL